MKFLFDNNLPRPLADSLRILSKPVAHVAELKALGKKAPDDLIMQYAAEFGYFVVTRDMRQMEFDWFKPTLVKLGAGYFFVRAAKAKGVEMQAWPLARMIIKAWDEIERYGAGHKAPFTAIVKPGGGVSNYRQPS